MYKHQNTYQCYTTQVIVNIYLHLLDKFYKMHCRCIKIDSLLFIREMLVP